MVCRARRVSPVVLVPLVSLSACALVLAPGLFLTHHPERSAPEWLFRAFAVSLGVVSVITGVAQAALPVVLHGRLYALVLVASARWPE